MGADTKGLIKGYVSADEVLNFIRQKYDKDAKNCVKSMKCGELSTLDFGFVMQPNHETDTEWVITSGFINFSYNGEIRSLFYSYNNINPYENLEYYEKNYSEYTYLSDMIKSETVSLSLGKDDDAITIMTDILSYFGGWIDANDCDDIPYIPVPSKLNDDIEPIKYITMDDIYKVFGKNIVIKDLNN